MTRERLPNRRLHHGEPMQWNGSAWSLGVGFDEAGRVAECFLDGAKSGGQIEAILQDSCVALSLLLQYGLPAADLARHFAREGVDPAAPAASPIGLVARRAAAIETEEGAAMAAAYAAAVGAGLKPAPTQGGPA